MEGNSISAQRSSEPIIENVPKKKNGSTMNDEKIVKIFKEMKIDSEDLPTLIDNLYEFNSELENLKDVESFLTVHNLNKFKKLSSKGKIKINLILKKIYMNIINNDSLYSNYLSNLIEEKINLIIEFIEECVSLVEKFSGFILDQELYKFKLKIIELTKCIYFNCKKEISQKNNLYKKLQTLIDKLPGKFFSEPFNELNKDKTLIEIQNSLRQNTIDNFEDKFTQINNYYEQFDIFKKFVELNSEISTYDSFAGDENDKIKAETKVKEIDTSKVDFYKKFGLLILKFIVYHKYIFINNANIDNKGKKEEEEEETNENIRIVFLLDKIKQNNDNEKEKTEEEKIDEMDYLMNGKIFTSILGLKEYNDLIKKEINYYINLTKPIENMPEIKGILEQMKYFLTSLDSESFIPLFLNDLSKILVMDHFSSTFLINVPAGKAKEFYVETEENETRLLYIAFFLEDKNKDISFQVNKYDINTDSYKTIFNEEKVEDIFKFFILCNGYSLYQIIFNNNYSWFTSKDVTYKITELKLIGKNTKISEKIKEEMKKEKEANQNLVEKDKKKKEEKEEEKSEEEQEEEEKVENNEEEINEEDKPILKINGESIGKNELEKKIQKIKEEKDENLINIPVILYLNNLRLFSKENKEFIEKVEEDESFIPKELFNYTLANYIKKTLKIKKNKSKNKNINISIFSQNRDLSSMISEIEELKEETKSLKVKRYLEKIGFYPGKDLEGFKVKYNLYDLCEQSLFYRLFLTENEMPKKPLLFIQIDKVTTNAVIYNKGEITYRLGGKEGSKLNSSNFDNININDMKRLQIFINSVNVTFKGIDILISCIDLDEEMKKTASELINRIKKFCEEKTSPVVEVYVDEKDEIAKNVLDYIY